MANDLHLYYIDPIQGRLKAKAEVTLIYQAMFTAVKPMF